MRVLMTGDTAGGVFTFVTELSRALAAEGHEVTLATFGPTTCETLKAIRWFHHSSKLEWQSEPWGDIETAADWLREIVEKEAPDVLHFNTLCHGELAGTVPVVTTIHSCVPTWWRAVRKTPLPLEWSRYRQTIYRSLARASMLIFPSEALREMFHESWQMAGVQSSVVPNGVDHREYRVLPKEPFVLAAGRFWDDAKNMQALEAIAEDVAWPIYLAGEVETESRCKALGKVSRIGIRDWYSRAAIFVSPALYEPFGLAVLEAAASGCALVLNDIPTFRENWTGAALSCTPDTLGDTINQLIGNELFRGELQQKAFERARCFTHSAMAQRYAALYEEARTSTCVS